MVTPVWFIALRILTEYPQNIFEKLLMKCAKDSCICCWNIYLATLVRDENRKFVWKTTWWKNISVENTFWYRRQVWKIVFNFLNFIYLRLLLVMFGEHIKVFKFSNVLMQFWNCEFGNAIKFSTIKFVIIKMGKTFLWKFL